MTRRRRETRRRLIDVAFEVFAEHGIADAPVEVICERAGFTRGAFYSNFSSKEGLFLALYEEELAGRLARLRESLLDVVPAAPVADAAARVIGLFTEHFATDATWYRLTAEFELHSLRRPELRGQIAAARQGFQDGMQEALQLALARMGLRLVVPVEDALLALEAIYEAVLRRSLLLDGPVGGAVDAVNGLLPRVVTALVGPADPG